MQIRNSWSRFSVVAAALAMTACATTSTLSVSSSEEAKHSMLVERADARGMALVQGNLDAAYEFLSEGSKVMISKDEFKRRMSIVAFRAYRIDTASCEGASCTVKAKLTYDHRVMKSITTPMTERWVIEGGKVFYVFPAG